MSLGDLYTTSGTYGLIEKDNKDDKCLIFLFLWSKYHDRHAIVKISLYDFPEAFVVREVA